jgi:transcriptional regulator with XRE-family HTH domain/ATP/maltotriose-dependent transcriptional regulator MalT
MGKLVRTRRRVVVDESALAQAIGARIKERRLGAGLTQAALAGDRYTKAYISALEHGLAKPSMAALNYLAPRLGTTAAALIADRDPTWERVEADLAMASGDWQGAFDTYDAILQSETDRGRRADLQVAMAECLCRMNRARDAIRPATEAVETYAALGRAADGPLAEYWLASAQFQSDNLVGARTIVTSLIGRIRDGLQVRDDFHVRLLVSAAMIETSAGNAGQALAYLEEARGRSADLDIRRRGALLATLATAYRTAGDLEGAIRHGQEAIALLRVAEADIMVQDLENELAMAYLANGNIARATELAQDARSMAEARGDLHILAHVADTQATIALAAGDPDEAIRLATESIHISETGANERGRISALITRARAYAASGDHAAAARDFEVAAAGATDLPARRREVLSAWADSLAALGQHDRAFALAREALDNR